MPDGAECLVTEREAEGRRWAVSSSSVLRSDPVPVKAGEVAAVLMTNTYTPAPGNIAVTKKVVGDILPTRRSPSTTSVMIRLRPPGQSRMSPPVTPRSQGDSRRCDLQ